jgi:LytS/YehU family sensor histidine kinase
VAVFLIGFDGVVHGWLATFIYVGLRNSRRAARALAGAEIARSEANRALIAAQLEAAHAEVDPAVVFRALEDVERAYEEDPARADALLDELIAFLRDAIPRLRSVGPALEGIDEPSSRPR